MAGYTNGYYREVIDFLKGLLEPGGVVATPLETGCVFPDVGVRESALWSMLYLSGYLTKDLTATPNDKRVRRPLRIPNKEVCLLFRNEIIERFAHEAGGENSLMQLQDALVAGDEEALTASLGLDSHPGR